MRLLDLIEQQHAVRLLGDRLGQQATLVETNVTGRRTDQARHGVTLHVLGHVETHQLDTHGLGQLPCGLGLAHASRASEQEGADRLVRRLEAGTRQLDRGCQRVDGSVLTEYGELEVTFQITQQLLVGAGHVLRRNPRDLGNDILDLCYLDTRHALFFRLQTLVGAGLVDDVDGLVRHVPIIDVARSQLSRCTQGFVTVFDVVMLLEARLEPLENADGVLYRRLDHVDLLEASRQRAVFLEDAAEFLEGGGTDAANFTRGQHRLEQIGGIHDPARRRASTDDGVNLVDEEDRMRPLAQLIEQRLEALLEVAAVLGAGQQCTEVQGIDHAVGQQIRHLLVDYALGQAFGDGCLANTSLAYQQRVVLAPTRENLRNTLDFMLATDQWIDTSLTSQFVEVAGVGIQRIAGS